MNKFKWLVPINLILIKLCVTVTNPLEYGETQTINDPNFSEENEASNHIHFLPEGTDDSLIQRRVKTTNRRERTPIVRKTEPAEVEEDEESEEDTDVVKPTVKRNISRKSRSINRRSKRCGRGRKCNRGCRICRGRRNRIRRSINKRAPIKPHNSIEEEPEEEEEESEPEVENKPRINPNVKRFAAKLTNKVSDHALSLGSSLARDYFNKKVLNAPNDNTKFSIDDIMDKPSNQNTPVPDNTLSKGSGTSGNSSNKKVITETIEQKTKQHSHASKAPTPKADNELDFGEDSTDDKPDDKDTEEDDGEEDYIKQLREQMFDDVQTKKPEPKKKPTRDLFDDYIEKDKIKSNKKLSQKQYQDNSDDDYLEQLKQQTYNKVETKKKDYPKKPTQEEYYDGEKHETDATYRYNKPNEFQQYNYRNQYKHSQKDPSDDDDDYEDMDQEEEEKEDYTKKFKTPSGLEYLGAGYDLIKGNPFGDNITLLDPGYRSSVIQMHWNKKLENISNSMQFLQPVGGWIRPYSSCHKVESVTEIKSSELFLKSLSADASVSFSLSGDSLKFAASAKFKKLNDASKSGDRKIYINKSYCFKYVAGISTSLKWLGRLINHDIRDLTLGFQSSLERLTEFRGLEKDSGCEPFVYREDPNNENCQEAGVTDWMEMFNSFGTHVSNKIYLGGKILTTLEVEKNQEKKLSDQGVDVKAALSAQIKDTSVDSNVKVSTMKSESLGGNLLSTKKTTFVLGGDIYGDGKEIDFGDWSKTVSDHAMPIKAEFTPISHFIDKSLSESYNKAYLYYGKVVTESDYWRYQSQIELTPEDLIYEMDIKHVEGNSSVTVTCKDGMLIQFGFMIITLTDNSHKVIPCPIQKNQCSSPERDDLIHSSLWISCRKKNIVNIKQVVTKDKDPSCDPGWTIFLGSSFFESNSRYLLMKPCKLGHDVCETDENTLSTWIVCFKKFWDLSSKTKVVKKNSSSLISCKDGESIVFGIGFEWTKDKDNSTFPTFISAQTGQTSWLHNCKAKCNRIIQYIICK